MEAIERKEYEVQKRLCDDRFSRDKEAITQNDTAIANLTRLVTEMATMQKQSMAQTAIEQLPERLRQSVQEYLLTLGGGNVVDQLSVSAVKPLALAMGI